MEIEGLLRVWCKLPVDALEQFVNERRRRARGRVQSMTSEVLAAIITVGGTVVLAVFQTTRALKEQAKLNAAPELAKLRYPAYEGLWNITDVGPGDDLKNLETRAERETIADAMTRWYYPNGLALSGPSQR